MISYKNEFLDYITTLQNDITHSIERQDGKTQFIEDKWQRDGGGGGKTRVLSNGKIFEKGGVNISNVYGKLPQTMVEYLKVTHHSFFACGISLVLHPFNPFVPTVHANYRYFELYNDQNELVDQWFAGGADLTPYYLFEEDAVHFHQKQKEAADSLDTSYYPKYKRDCDQYFWNHHRGEARGIGGTFFDYLRPTEKADSAHWYQFVTTMGQSFLPSYIPIVEKRKNMSFDATHKYWQEIRRGRYVEFNLIHDKGTLFGLKTNGRIESILMSLPSTVRWDYNYSPEEHSEESKLIDVLKKPKNWIL